MQAAKWEHAKWEMHTHTRTRTHTAGVCVVYRHTQTHTEVPLAWHKTTAVVVVVVARSSNQTKKEERKRTARDASKLNSEWNSVFAAGQERKRNVLANGTCNTHTHKHTQSDRGEGGMVGILRKWL